MKTEDELYCWNTDSQAGFQLDWCADRFAESKQKWKAKIARGVIYPNKFIVSNNSPSDWMYDTKVYKSSLAEEKQL